MSRFGLLKEADLTPPNSPVSLASSPSTTPMVETNSNQMTIRSTPLTKNLSIPNQAYLTTAMLLGTQNCNYLGQRLNNLREHINENDLVLNASVQPVSQQTIQMQPNLNRTHLERDNGKDMARKDDVKIRDCNSGSMPSSTFTIDSILASKPVDIKFEYNSKSESRSPSNSPSLSATSSPVRPTRVPAMLHPGLHLSHLAAAAATGFGNPSDFLGECENWFSPSLRYFCYVVQITYVIISSIFAKSRKPYVFIFHAASSLHK